MHRPRIQPLPLTVLSAAALALAACTTAPPSPPANIGLAEAAIESAHTAGADEAARAEMDNARAKLASARQTNRTGNPILAAQLADEAEVDAHVARAKTAYLRSAKALDLAETDLRTLESKPLPTPAPAPAPAR